MAGGVASNTLGTGDVLDGGDGFDTLEIIDSAGNTLAPTMSNIERINAQNVVTATPLMLNLINAAGVQQIWNYRSSDKVGVYDVQVTNVQEEAVVGFEDTEADMTVDFASDVDFGGDATVVVDNAGTAFGGGKEANLILSGGNADEITTLNVVAAAGENFLGFEIEEGSNADLEMLNISGAGGLTLRESDAAGNETDTVTMVDATALEGSLDLDLSNNDEDIDFDGGDGDTTLVTGDGASTIDTGAGDDNVTVGTGDNVINTNGGDDSVDISAGGDQTVALGDDDDTLVAGSELTDADAVEAGDGTDTLTVDVAAAAAFTANGDVDAVVNGFEVLDLNGSVDAGQSYTINLDNIDDIQYVKVDKVQADADPTADVSTVSDGTPATPGVTAEKETTTVEFSFLPAGESVTVEGYDGSTETVTAPSGTGTFEEAVVDWDNIQVSGFNPGFGGPGFGGIQGFLTIQINGLELTLSSETNGTNQTYKKKEIVDAIVTGADTTNIDVSGSLTNYTAANTGGSGEVTFTATSFGNLSDLDITSTKTAFTTVNGEPTPTPDVTDGTGASGGRTADDVAQEFFNAGLPGYIDLALNGDEVTYTADTAGDRTDITATSTAGSPFEPVVDVTNQGVDGVPGDPGTFEVQTVEFTSGLEDGQSITVGGRTVTAEGGILTKNQVASAFDSGINGSTVITGSAVVTGTLGYSTALAGTTVTLTATTVGDKDPVSVTTTDVGGDLTLEYTAPGGTLEMGGANSGIINVNIDNADGDDDEFNIVLATDENHNGIVNLAGVETLNVTTEVDGSQSNLDINAPDLVTLNVTGTSGVDFTGSTGLTNLETVDASGLDIASDEDGVTIATANADGTTFIGSLGKDDFTGAAGADVMNGGDGDDILTGGAGADVMTGGAGADTFVYTAASESSGTAIDTITDFISGEDKIDLTSVGGGGSYLGEVNSLSAANTALTGNVMDTVFDTSTSQLYVDVDGSGDIGTGDMLVELTGVTTLDDTTDFIF